MGRTNLSAQPLDRLGLLTLLSGLYFLQVWALTIPGSPLPQAAHELLMLISLISIALPRLTILFVVNATAFFAQYLLASPIASNNQTVAFFFCVVVLIALCRRGARADTQDAREELFRSIAAPGRWLLAVMYFYGIYHKINIDFLDPTVSCAVELYRPLARPFGLDQWIFGHYAAIYATFIVEAIAMVLLFVPRYKRLGLAIGLPFHIVIGWTGYAYYKDFSTLVLLLYALFLSREALERSLCWASSRLPSKEAAVTTGRSILFLFVFTYLMATFLLFDGVLSVLVERNGFVPAFTIYAALFYIFAVASTRWNEVNSDPRLAAGGWTLIVPVLFFLNGASPYLGLKTESSIAMFSNLHTEGGETNHLLHGTLPFAASWQDELVYPIGSNNPTFDAYYVGPNKALVRYHLDKILAQNPDLIVQISLADEIISTDINWQNTYEESNWLTRKFLIFKPIDFERPKVCTH